ncbi:helix-turn-helix transcriptional regulator [Pantoea endophytica]|uniref:helix-turn-helix transcriptional regulator n=1 Tax=Pantoea endophytica TaxID=92488 RepID=UPI0024136DD6|nr:helix-turn-helix transcriptional regulator [Pantoea endophytica]
MRKNDIKNFLTNHRSRIDPRSYGFSTLNRRVKGLRREEVAQLAAVSVSWYTWLEQGREISISPAAIKRIGKVLQLSTTEQEYLEALVFGKNNILQINSTLPAEVIAMVDALNPHPAFVRRANMDIIYWNDAAKTLFFDWSNMPQEDRNSLKLMFICEDYRTRIHEWEKAARHTISAFRAYYAASNKAQEFESVIDDLLARSEDFRIMWNYHDVSKMGAGNKTIIDVNGKVNSFTYTSLEVENSPGMYLIFYMAR